MSKQVDLLLDESDEAEALQSLHKVLASQHSRLKGYL